jgi:hypothetical protein
MTKVHIFSIVTKYNKLVPQFTVLSSQKLNLLCIIIIIIILTTINKNICMLVLYFIHTLPQAWKTIKPLKSYSLRATTCLNLGLFISYHSSGWSWGHSFKYPCVLICADFLKIVWSVLLFFWLLESSTPLLTSL